ncbi:MAG: 1-acyl-sn-glycerol-3-phosphate acyltransferase [Acidobacteria bacterium]|jgi:1-acyl-sn-glycerol-3-phosphate acyltransferase|nr:1-acyl-sn-glycerol-3-phosphate acyltransferase [Acidobacteriota bacterium]
MARTIIWFAYFWLFQLVSTLFLPVYFVLGLLGREAARDRFLLWVTSTWARQMVAVAGGRVEVSGLENLPRQQGALFVANHQGAFDIPLLIGFVPVLKGFVSKKENFRLPIVSTWMRLLGCIVIDRGDLRQSAGAIARGVRDLKAGRSLVIFPEGTRSKSGQLQRFKEGSFKLATRSGAAIVPLTIDGSYRLLEGNRGRIQPGTVRLHIHPPVILADLDAGQRKDPADLVRGIIAARLPEPPSA